MSPSYRIPKLSILFHALHKLHLPLVKLRIPPNIILPHHHPQHNKCRLKTPRHNQRQLINRRILRPERLTRDNTPKIRERINHSQRRCSCGVVREVAASPRGNESPRCEGSDLDEVGEEVAGAGVGCEVYGCEADEADECEDHRAGGDEASLLVAVGEPALGYFCGGSDEVGANCVEICFWGGDGQSFDN
jgi:hypothetical protein